MSLDLDSQRRRANAIVWAQSVAQDATAVFLDTETTGLGDGAEIIDIGIVDVAGNVLLDALVRPMRPIPTEATAVHGITDAMVAEAPTFGDIAAQLGALIDRRRVVVYNAQYDLAMVNQCGKAAGWADFVRDEWQCAMLAFADFDGTLNRRGEPKWHKLDAAAARFGIVPGGHRALADANAARLVVLAMARAGQIPMTKPQVDYVKALQAKVRMPDAVLDQHCQTRYGATFSGISRHQASSLIGEMAEWKTLPATLQKAMGQLDMFEAAAPIGGR